MYSLFFIFSFSNQIYKISIEGTIIWDYPICRRSIKDGSKRGIGYNFEINTFGGRVDVATQIKDAILGTEVLSIAYINRRAISAGALISLSCEKIYMSGGGLIGAATAVDMSRKKEVKKLLTHEGNGLNGRERGK